MTSHSKRSSTISAPITNLDFPEELAHYKWHCSLGEMCRNNIRPLRSTDFGIPQIISIRKSLSKSSSYNSTSPPASSFKPLSKNPSHLGTSKVLVDTKHRKSIRVKKIQFTRPCADSVEFGAPVSLIGKCPAKDRQQFKLTEDPRKRFCLKNPNRIHFKPIAQPVELAKVKELVKTADNVISSSESHSSNSSICQVIDLANPLGLDFQGTDYKNTYERDEQSCQNQIEYRKVRRFQHRRNVQLETVQYTEKEQQAERIAIPKCFAMDDSSVQHAKPIVRLSNVLNKGRHMYGRLVRAEQKPEVYKILKEEEQNRRERYKQLYIKKKQKTARKHEEEIQNEKAVAADKATVLAEKDIQDFVNLLDRTIITKKMNPRQIPERKKFPHNISETIKFRYDMKKSKRILRDSAIVKQNFYQQMGIPKKIPETELAISTDSNSPSTKTEEQSTNDEDDMVVGQKGSKFILRGFRYKMGTNLKGKFNQHELAEKNGKMKGCITRTEWFESLVPRKVQKNDQRDLEMKLYPQELGLKPFHAKSAIREFRKKPLGGHYDRTVRKKLHIKRPKTMKVRKFNLIGFLYGKSTRNKSVASLRSSEAINLKGCTMEYVRNKTEKEKLKKKIQKRQRMQYLGIPYSQEKIQKTKSKCVDSDSGDSDWIPDEIPNDKNPSEHIDLRGRGNMPASENRETTLRQIPKNSRDYKHLRVPSPLLNEYVQAQHIPVLRKLRDDKIVVENVRNVKPTEYAKKFGARHHHDHWNPTQHKSVNVRYSRKIVKPKLLKRTSQVDAREKSQTTFDKARPRGSNVDEQDFSIPMYNFDEIIENHGNKIKSDTKRQTKEHVFHQSKDMPIHSLGEDEFQEFPGRDKFLEFIRNIKTELNKRSGVTDTSQLVIDKKSFIDELKEDLLSIESCLSSLSSSECTNLSNDSGSFLMAGDKKIPLDYLRKSVVPFEEMNRHRIEAIPIDASKEELNPYRTVPFAGQQREQLSMTTAKDNFFTFNTRLQNGMRQRLEVKTEDPKKKVIGPKKGPKEIAQVATDIDELYIEDLKKPPSLKPFKWNSCRTMIKDALRKKFESMLIQGEIVRTKINDRRNEEYYQQMIKSKELFERLFAKWEKKEYEAAMEVVNRVKPYYEATDIYRKDYQELSKEFTVLNMDIVYIENDWTRRTILQNFHYLLADMEWRVEHDWIHRNEDGSLEGFQESIVKRSIVNIRKRDKDDAWAVKKYYEEIFLKNPHPIIVVFPNAKEFINGIENLKSKTFVLLLELHYTLWILAELEQRYQEFNDWCTVELASKKKFAENKCANKYYMEDRAGKLKEQMNAFLGDPIDETFGDKRLSQIKGICNEIYKHIVPDGDQMDLSALEQVAAISEVLDELLGKFENIPVAQRNRVEKKHRRLLAYRRKMSKQAVFIERRIASEMVKVKRNLAPPFVKPKRQGNLPRSELKKVIRVREKRQISMSQQTKFFYKAFHDEGDPKGLKEARESLDVIEGIQKSIVPFYFDHFLIINGYQPSYDFQTQVELRDGPEIDRMQVKKVLPEVMEKFEKWQIMKKRIMEENISKNPQMYQNVRI
ncbi:uncharacterized protein LOC129918314 [Episyrphus balteatus]|uniref:uncharacterized protein LOC129918314 n=1 Tax=Episyrphus balteatus TaxID=286459 RepID=UPI002486141F|nr:uncharacterized protein LOC129918314 [Episyrphus balteatus]